MTETTLTPEYRAKLRQQVIVHPDMSVNDKTIIISLLDEIDRLLAENHVLCDADTANPHPQVEALRRRKEMHEKRLAELLAAQEPGQ